jgi:mannose-1-phosphate guanylyltransferase
MKNLMRTPYCIIMAGGIGSRFWPMSTEEMPKQFLDFLGTGESLLQQTYKRVRRIFEPQNIFIVTHEKYAELTLLHLPELPKENLIEEPLRRNTAPCIAYAVLKIKKRDPQANMFITPADHLITDEEAFEKVIRQGLDRTNESDCFVTVGIKPHKPETGYGYIQYDETSMDASGSFRVKAFTEKPDIDHAKLFLESGDFLWNAGMFIWNLPAVTQGLDKHLPELMSTLGETWNDLDTPYEKDSVARVYGECDNISIDYGLMERAEEVCVIPAEMGWSDLGNWGAIYDLGEKDEEGNVTIGERTLVQQCKNCLIVNGSKNKALVVTHLEDKMVIQTDLSTLTLPMGNDQAIKQIVKSVNIEIGESFV